GAQVRQCVPVTQPVFRGASLGGGPTTLRGPGDLISGILGRCGDRDAHITRMEDADSLGCHGALSFETTNAVVWRSILRRRSPPSVAARLSPRVVGAAHR